MLRKSDNILMKQNPGYGTHWNKGTGAGGALMDTAKMVSATKKGLDQWVGGGHKEGNSV